MNVSLLMIICSTEKEKEICSFCVCLFCKVQFDSQ